MRKLKVFIKSVFTKEIFAALVVSIFGLIPISINLHNSDLTHQKDIDIRTHVKKAELYASTMNVLDEIADLYPNILLDFTNLNDQEFNITKKEFVKFTLQQFTKAQKKDTELFYNFYSLEPYIADKDNTNYIVMLIKNITGESSDSIYKLLNSYNKKTKNKNEIDYTKDEILETLAHSTNKNFSNYTSNIYNYKNEIKICLKDFLFGQGKCPYVYVDENNKNSN